mmetsp:Transcript_22839/g.27610  ORF Transcript_22839/g.27610 Transcript_22839/m.27610 type:complete len:398 (+) Transcript_22839:181-1374(+)|eukprot:CAMPEP_0197854094 /NCGR_PEP_ID=MMETSP1438-20131217/24015_1 /TAXON_ID=1461541 /ORGANISM="Pterosperma sp., Strain CCMP1384" /LENGTH=397 /DNA_ID=CAMNT_0043468733 /DNA_START=67 /DNA_END=1260 /DNA_ORIENTATION=-
MSQALETGVQEFILQLKRRQREGSIQTSRKTLELLRQVVSAERRVNGPDLRAAVRRVGRRLLEAKPTELSVGNMVRRALHIIREEEQQLLLGGSGYDEDFPDEEEGDLDEEGGVDEDDNFEDDEPTTRMMSRTRSLASLLDQGRVGNTRGRSASKDMSRKLKHSVMLAINDLIDDLDNISSQIAEQAIWHIHASEVILTFGNSPTTKAFLQEAAKKRSFAAVVAEAAPSYSGHTMARELAALGVQTTAITDSAIFAMMARVNMVVVACSAVLANGGIIGPVGVHMVALAARQHAVPFVVLTGLHKLSPEQPFDPDVTFNDIKNPAALLDFAALAEGKQTQEGGGNLHVPNPTFDYVPPELISLFITDSGGHCPSYVYRLLAEYYSPEDYNLNDEKAQ